LSLFKINVSVGDLTGGVLSTFASGVLLMELAEQLEKKSFSNWERRPKNKAFCLKNIKRALEIFKLNKRMNLK